MKTFFRRFFTFSNSEEKGKLILLFCFALVFLALLTRNHWWPNNVEHAKAPILVLEYHDTTTAREKIWKKKDETSLDKTINFDPKPFNPNSVSQDELEAMGIPGSAAHNLIAFRKSGAIYAVKGDVKKVYGLDDKLFASLMPFILLPDSIESKPDLKKKVDSTETIPVADINQIDSAALTRFKGIGPAFASRIVAYREALGGFYAKKQLYEVYGLDSAVATRIIETLVLESSPRKRLSFNSAEFKILLKHPYISYKQAQAISNYRDQHGPYQSINDLHKIISLDSTWVKQIAPYFSTE